MLDSFIKQHVLMMCRFGSDIIPMIKCQDLVGRKVRGWTFIKELGAGQHGKVFQVRDEKKNITAAAKVMSKILLTEKPKLLELVDNQKRVLKSVNNENVVRYIGQFTTPKSMVIVMELCNGGELQDYLNDKKRLSQQEATCYLKQIINGFKGLHEVRAMHRDFKAANVLLHDGVCKIADLGFAKQLKDKNGITSTMLGTGLTAAPEILEQKVYGLKADLWSVGVVFYQLIYGKYPFFAVHPNDILKQIYKGVDFDGVKISPVVKDFISRCLVVKPKDRMSWAELYDHPLITSSHIKSVVLDEPKKISQNKMFYSQEENQQTEMGVGMDLQKKEVLRSVVQVEEEQLVMIEPEYQQKVEIQEEETQRVLIHLASYQQLYLSQRNKIMFVFRHILPHCHTYTTQVPVSHHVPLFLLAKKSYLEMKSFADLVVQQVNFNNLSPDFESFSQSKHYQALVQLVLQDLQEAQLQATIFQSQLPLPQDEQDELKYDIESPWMTSYWHNLLDNDIRNYQYLLIENLDVVEGEQKKGMIETIEGLSHYRKHQCSLEQFQKRMKSLNHEQAYVKQRERWLNSIMEEQ